MVVSTNLLEEFTPATICNVRQHIHHKFVCTKLALKLRIKHYSSLFHKKLVDIFLVKKLYQKVFIECKQITKPLSCWPTQQRSNKVNP